MSKRYILDDSDSEFEDEGGGGDDFFTDKEKNAINRCQIQINNTGGIYSHENMLRAIENVGMTLLEKLDTDDGDGGHRYRVKVGSRIEFFERDIYKVHDSNNNARHPCTEEAILLEIEALRQSEKATKNRMFKQKKTGAMVVFGPWFNYAFQRLLQLASSNNGSSSATTSISMGGYTVVKIIRSLFSFITDDLKDIVKYGKLNDLKTKRGVDWLRNVGTARKVINHCGDLAKFLHDELVKVEAHVQSLVFKSSRLGDKVTPVMSLAPAPPAETLSDPRHTDANANTTMVVQVPSKQQEAPQDKQMMAQKKRFDAMKARAMAANSVAPTETTVTVPSVAKVNQKTEQSIIQSSAHQSRIPPQTIAGANSILGGASNGWGRVRDGSQVTQPYRTKLGTWEMSMRILGTKLQGTSLQEESFSPNHPHKHPPRSDDLDSSRSTSGFSHPPVKRESFHDNNGRNGRGVKHGRSSDYDDRGIQPEKRRTDHVHNTQPEWSAPVTAPLNGVGRGRGATLPSWVTQQTIAPSNQVVEYVPGPSLQHVGRVSTSNSGQGRGRGRGASVNLPAWMTENNP